MTDPTITICRQCGGFDRESIGRWLSPASCELCKQLKPAAELNICIRLDFKSPATPSIRSLPNAVKQTTRTNCFRACVATVLNMPIEDVPEACDGAKWDWDAFQDWLATRNLQAVEMTFLNGGTLYPVRKPILCIATGQSPRLPEVRHAVVAEFIGLEGFRLLFDPHMDDLWIDGEPTHATFFVPMTIPAPPSKDQS